MLAEASAESGGTQEALDPRALERAFRHALALRRRRPGPLAPAPVLELPAAAERARAREAGEALLAAGQVAALVVAGGQATRLDWPGPKGLFPIGPVSDRTLFALQAQKLRRLERRFGRRVPWIVMTSLATDAATRAYFAREGQFGLDIRFIRQREAPCLDLDGRPLWSAPGRLATAPDGHGGVLWALAASGMLERLVEAGIRALAYHQVDNPLARMADPTLLGLLLTERAEVASKVVRKARPDESLGTAVRSEGRVRVIEYTELAAEDAAAPAGDGRLRLWAGAIGLHAFALDFLTRLAPRADELLPYHASPKAIPVPGAVAPREPNGYKLERFVFDLFPEARALVMVEAQRENEYAPVKSAEGTHSPAAARRALDACARRWLGAAGHARPDPALLVELDHAVVDGPEDAARLFERGAPTSSPAIRIGPGVSA